MDARAKPLCDLVRRCLQIAVFVNGIDQHAGNQAFLGRGDRHGHLFTQMLMQRRLARDKCVDVGTIFQRRPIATRKGETWRQRTDRRVFGKDIVSGSIEIVGNRLGTGFQLIGRPIGALIVPSQVRAIVAWNWILDVLAGVIAFQQGVLHKFALNKCRKLQRRKLKQLDRLHQLRRDLQRLALAQDEFRRHTHAPM